VEGLEDQLRRLKTQLEETTRQNQDLNNLKARMTQENFELQRQVQELDASNAALSKARSQLQAQLDEAKARLDEETRVGNAVCLCLRVARGAVAAPGTCTPWCRKNRRNLQGKFVSAPPAYQVHPH